MVGGLRVRPRIDPRWVRTDGSRDCRGGPRDDRSAAGSDIPHSSARAHRDRGGSVNPADLEVLQTALSFIPEEMGVALRRTAYSPNIKERMDASCALFDAEGRIVSQAEHIPVHLGSMPVAVEAAMRDFPGTLREGNQSMRSSTMESGGFGRPSANCLGELGPRRSSSKRPRRGNRSESGFMRKSRSAVLASRWISRARIARSPAI